MTSAARHEPQDQGRESPCPELFEAWLGDSLYDVQVRADEGLVSADPTVDAGRHFRDVLGLFASGVTVVTAVHDGEPVGLTCQSFSSVSLDPPLVLFVPSRTSRAWPLIRASGAFCVNLLGADQTGVANTMASRGADKFAGAGWRPSPVTGSPVLAGTLGHVDCVIHQVHEAGDHDVVIGRVVDLAAGPAASDPLLFYRGRYRTTS